MLPFKVLCKSPIFCAESHHWKYTPVTYLLFYVTAYALLRVLAKWYPAYSNSKLYGLLMVQIGTDHLPKIYTFPSSISLPRRAFADNSHALHTHQIWWHWVNDTLCCHLVLLCRPTTKKKGSIDLASYELHTLSLEHTASGRCRDYPNSCFRNNPTHTFLISQHNDLRMLSKRFEISYYMAL